MDAFPEGIPPFGGGHAPTDSINILSIFYTPRTIQGKAAWRGTRQTKALLSQTVHPTAKWSAARAKEGQRSGEGIPLARHCEQGAQGLQGLPVHTVSPPFPPERRESVV